MRDDVGGKRHRVHQVEPNQRLHLDVVKIDSIV